MWGGGPGLLEVNCQVGSWMMVVAWLQVYMCVRLLAVVALIKVISRCG